MPLIAGTHLGPYEIVSALGAGGMGEVYRTRDTKLGRDVAIKVLPDTVAQDAERLARFEREAQLLAALNHPHIGAIYGLEEFQGVRFLILELVDGGTLAQRIARGPIPLPEALAIAREVVGALEAAHEKGIVHRDLKPANIALTADGQVKVLDFGLAKAAAPASSPDMANSPTLTFAGTQVGVILGTAAYMSPEQAKGRAADKRCDVWAFGCVLFEMLSGKKAFEGEDISDTLAAVLRGEPDWTVGCVLGTAGAEPADPALSAATRPAAGRAFAGYRGWPGTLFLGRRAMDRVFHKRQAEKSCRDRCRCHDRMRRVKRARRRVARRRHHPLCAAGDWSPDARVRRGGTPTVLFPLRQGEATQRWPQVLPGGKSVLYTTALTVGAEASFASGALVIRTIADGSAAFSVSQTGALVYQTRPATASQLTWLDRGGKRLGVLGDRAEYSGVALSPDGRQALVSVATPGGTTRSLWIVDITRNLARRFTPDADDGVEAAWAADGL